MPTAAPLLTGQPHRRGHQPQPVPAAITLADKYNFIIASDECYSEVYLEEDNPPPGLLQACAEMGRHDYSRCVVFHSLSKRSNLPGLRSGFVAGDKSILKNFLRYRTYHGCAMSTVVQLASAAAWSDESHVIENRSLYRENLPQSPRYWHRCWTSQSQRPALPVAKNPAGGYRICPPAFQTAECHPAAGSVYVAKYR